MMKTKKKQNISKSNSLKKKQLKNEIKTFLVKETEFLYNTGNQFKIVKKIDDSWDFRKSNTKEYTHCFHSYPAMMIPQVARRIIENFGKKAQILFDPYCGTGTSLVEANLKGIDSIGTDLNPLARLIAMAKTTKIDIQVLDLFLHDFVNYFFSINFQPEKIKVNTIPDVKNIDFWFSKNDQQNLAILLNYINKIKDEPIKYFFKVAYSETVRESSFVKLGEFKLVRNKNFNEIKESDVFGIMIKKLSRNKKGLIEFQNESKNNARTYVYDFNTVNNIPKDILKENSADIVVTSPPYGDSRTTVAYGQYSRLANEWLGFKEANKIDNILMGGVKRKHNHIFKSDKLQDIIEAIKRKDNDRVRDVISFYEDYEKSIHNTSKIIKKGGMACYVVGNRTVKGIKIPNDDITADLFKENGFIHLETIVRNIPNKRMPLRNSPSNIVGETGSTMRNEYIVICEKK